MNKEFIERQEYTDTQDRLEYLRSVIEDESISYSEICELQSLAEYIPDDDMILREWAGTEEVI